MILKYKILTTVNCRMTDLPPSDNNNVTNAFSVYLFQLILQLSHFKLIMIMHTYTFL